MLSEVKADENYFGWRRLSAVLYSGGQAIFIEERGEARRLFTEARAQEMTGQSFITQKRPE